MAEDVVEITYLVSEEARRAPEEFVAEDVPENHVVSEDVGMLTGVTETGVTELTEVAMLISSSVSNSPALNLRQVLYKPTPDVLGGLALRRDPIR